MYLHRLYGKEALFFNASICFKAQMNQICGCKSSERLSANDRSNQVGYMSGRSISTSYQTVSRCIASAAFALTVIQK